MQKTKSKRLVPSQAGDAEGHVQECLTGLLSRLIYFAINRRIASMAAIWDGFPMLAMQRPRGE